MGYYIIDPPIIYGTNATGALPDHGGGECDGGVGGQQAGAPLKGDHVQGAEVAGVGHGGLGSAIAVQVLTVGHLKQRVMQK